MNSKKTVATIVEKLNAYKGIIDKLSASYQSEIDKREEEFNEMEGKYTDLFIRESRANWKPSKDYGKMISMAREEHKKTISPYLDQLQEELDNYFMAPVDSGFAATVTALKAVGARINNKEFQLLQSAAGGYFDRKLLSELAESRTKKADKVGLDETNEPERTTVDKPDPFFGVQIPDINKCYETLDRLKSSVEAALSNYCGENRELIDFVFPMDRERESAEKVAGHYGLEPIRPQRDAYTITRAVNAPQYFNENHQTYIVFLDMMEKIDETIPKPKVKTSLSENEKKLIDTMLDPAYPTTAARQAAKIAKCDERMAEILILDERYTESVKNALKEASENE